MAKLFAVFVLLLACCGTASAGFQAGMLRDARYFGNAAFLAYCPSFQIQTKTAMSGGRLYGVRESMGTNLMYVARDRSGRIIVSFRGSATMQNWMQNMQVQKMPLNWPGAPRSAQVHLGFMTAYRSLQGMVGQLVRQARYECPECQVVVTGHSLGGAIANLCALDLHLQGLRPMLYTYGQPRTGNNFFAAYFNSLQIPTVRYVNNMDMVPKVPPPAMGYQHVAGEVWQTMGGARVCQDERGESPFCSASVQMGNMMDHMTYFGSMMSACF